MASKMLTPAQRYQQDISTPEYTADPAQAEGLAALEQLYQKVMSDSADHSHSVYLWGAVGRGKSYLMDCFYQALRDSAKVTVERLHYYRFMKQLHQQLTALQGRKDPLADIAKQLVSKHHILCLDEFFVSDIGDAMLLGRLIKQFFDNGLILVTTSNVEPKALYKDGLQRDRFLPAIRMLESSMQIIQMRGDSDHRLAKATRSDYYLVEERVFDCANLLDSQLFATLDQAYVSNIQYDVELTIESRSVGCLAILGSGYCFSFDQLFCGPRSANDYIALANLTDTLYIVNVPQMGGQLKSRKVARGTEDTYNINQKVANRPFTFAKGDDEARRFISFIDEMYDQNKQVRISAQVPLTQLYVGGRVVFEFERTVSRIIEMQSNSYLKGSSKDL